MSNVRLYRTQGGILVMRGHRTAAHVGSGPVARAAPAAQTSFTRHDSAVRVHARRHSRDVGPETPAVRNGCVRIQRALLVQAAPVRGCLWLRAAVVAADRAYPTLAKPARPDASGGVLFTSTDRCSRSHVICHRNKPPTEFCWREAARGSVHTAFFRKAPRACAWASKASQGRGAIVADRRLTPLEEEEGFSPSSASRSPHHGRGSWLYTYIYIRFALFSHRRRTRRPGHDSVPPPSPPALSREHGCSSWPLPFPCRPGTGRARAVYTCSGAPVGATYTDSDAFSTWRGSEAAVTS